MEGILNIPIELRCAILRELPTVEDVWSAAQSTKVFYEAFQLDRHIVGPILCAQIDRKLLPYVAAFYEFNQSDSTDLQDRTQILQKSFSNTASQATEQLEKITLLEAGHAVDRYNAVRYFAQKYAAEAFALLRKEAVFDESMPPFSASEMHRIERSLFVFEIYCALYGRLLESENRNSTIREARERFFTQFTPWENEQLGCIYDFLLREFKPAFDEVAAHDIEFGEMNLWIGVKGFPSAKGAWFKGFVALGVEFLRQIKTARTYEERRRLLQKNLLYATSFPSLAQCLLDTYAIEEDDPQWLEDESWLEDDSMWGLIEGPNRFSRSDPDRGPAMIWYQDHEGCNQTQYVMCDDYRASRDVAYVMMDISRRGAMDQFKGRDVSKRWYPVDHKKWDQELQHKVRSCEARAAIYKRGGRGWWSEDDASQIQWLY